MKKSTFVLLLFLCPVFSLLANSYWEKNNPNSQEKIDHQIWDSFLQKHIQVGADGLNRIAYGKVAEAEKAALTNYVDSLQEVKITNYPSQEQKAYWINLYNALTVKVVLDHYPVDTIRDIKLSGLFKPGPWGKELVAVEGKKLSLDDVEHNILRPVWKDNRVHYAVNCASVGCPNLQNRAFTRDNMEQLLEKGAREYTQNTRGVDWKKDKLVVSSIYKWFQEDFGDSKQGVLQHLQKYTSASNKAKLQNYQGKITYYYDWSLNDSK
jgi:hypothetical protein